MANGYILTGSVDSFKLADFLKSHGEVCLYDNEVGIDEARRIKEIAAMSLGTDERRFFILDASKMKHHAFPVLLKVIEDALDKRHFFLLAKSPEMAPDTLRSRLVEISADAFEPFPEEQKTFAGFIKAGPKERAGIIDALAYEPDKFNAFLDNLERWAMDGEKHGFLLKIRRARESAVLNISRKMCLEYLAPFIT